MMNVFFFLLSVFLLMLTWKFIFTVVWALRWFLVAGFIGLLVILTPMFVSVYQDNQRAAKQVQDYHVTHPYGPTSNEIESDSTLKRLNELYKDPIFRHNVGLPTATATPITTGDS
jgi:hypothetical protein